jgi:mycothiol synthase
MTALPRPALAGDFSTRPATGADAPDICALIAACELDLDGRAEIDLDDIVSDLARPGRDLSRDTLLVHDAIGELVGWAQLVKDRRTEADVRPSHRGRGLGTRLLAWTETRAAEAGGDRVGQTITDNNPTAAALFRAHGYRPKDTAWILEIAMDTEPAVPELAGGITIRPFEPGRDDHAAHRVIDDAFGEWPDRQPSPFEEWHAFSVGRDTFAPRLSPLAFDGDRLVGVALSLDYQDTREGYVHQLAVHRDYRHRGIARALLRYAFRGFHREGRGTCVLSTNSYTGALSLYERVGMRIRQSYTHYEKPLTAAGSP